MAIVRFSTSLTQFSPIYTNLLIASECRIHELQKQIFFFVSTFFLPYITKEVSESFNTSKINNETWNGITLFI